MRIALLLIVLSVLDRFFPLIVGVYSLGFVSPSNKMERVLLYKSYGIARIPRTVFLLGALIFGSAPDWIANPDDIFVVGAAISMLLWAISAFFDVWRVRKNLNK